MRLISGYWDADYSGEEFEFEFEFVWVCGCSEGGVAGAPPVVFGLLPIPIAAPAAPAAPAIPPNIDCPMPGWPSWPACVAPEIPACMARA